MIELDLVGYGVYLPHGPIILVNRAAMGGHCVDPELMTEMTSLMMSSMNFTCIV